MGAKDKKSNSSSQKTGSQAKDTFNVKDNLRKLRSGTGKEGYETESDVYKTKSTDRYYGSGYNEDLGGYSSTSTIDRFEKINDKFNSDISVLKDNFSDHKEKTLEKLNDKLDKSELKYWIGGIIGGIIIVSGIVYTLSYQEIITDVKNLKENKNTVKEGLNDVDNRLQQLEKSDYNIKTKVK
jgi:hypothetical protein